jgi:phage gpG-like protein
MPEIQMTIRKADVDRLLKKLDPGQRDIAIRQSLTQSAIFLSSWIKTNRLSGPRPTILGVRTGRLRSSIATTPAQKSGDTYYCTIGTNVVYARIHEYGGQTGRNHAVNMPKRPFMRPAVEDRANMQGVLNDLKRNIDKQLEI